MNRTFRYSFVFAKIYGKAAKTYVGANFQDLLRLKRLQEIYDQLFPGQRVAPQEEPQSRELEAKIATAGISSMIQVLSLLRDPAEILVHILRKFEYQSLKSVIRSISRQGEEEPVIWDLGKYALLRPARSRDLEKAVTASPYAWILPHVHSRPLFEVENMLDRDYCSRLLTLARNLPRRDRTGVLRLVSLEMALSNAIWALRLRFFFGLDAQAAHSLLIPGGVDAHRKALTQAFEMPADSLEGWRQWKYGWLIDDQLGESFRAPDPVRAEQKATGRLLLRAHQLLHEDPFTLTPIVAYFKLKELETGMLKIAVEALQLSVPEHEVLSMVGAD
ncbi:MAG TPA: V-type ATPase subunit [Spirochaetia bacterium]|nr:V-type ATPase subunit [Spirochaetia bacterium]